MKDILLLSLAMLSIMSIIQGHFYRQNCPGAHNDAANAHMHHQHEHPKPASCDCGNSTTEARALGCKFDSLAAAWLPEHCRDDDLTAEFERSGDGPNGTWLYWADTKHTQLLSLEEIAAMADHLDARFHMSNHWHVVHCIFYWRKEHRARFNGKIVEPRSDNEGHIKHCGHVILNSTYATISGVALNTDDE